MLLKEILLAADIFTGLSFNVSEYTESISRKLPMYELNKIDCHFVATNFNDDEHSFLLIRFINLKSILCLHGLINVNNQYIKPIKYSINEK